MVSCEDHIHVTDKCLLANCMWCYTGSKVCLAPTAAGLLVLSAEYITMRMYGHGWRCRCLVHGCTQHMRAGRPLSWTKALQHQTWVVGRHLFTLLERVLRLDSPGR